MAPEKKNNKRKNRNTKYKRKNKKRSVYCAVYFGITNEFSCAMGQVMAERER